MSRARPDRVQSGGWRGFVASDSGGAIVLTALALVHRLLLLASNDDRHYPFSIFYEGDAETFFNHAVAIRSGAAYDAGIPFHPPLFAYLLAGIQGLLGAGSSSAPDVNLKMKVVLAALGSLPAGLLFVLARPFLGWGTAFLAGLLVAWHFGLSVLALSPVSEALFLNLLLLSLVVFTRAFGHPWSAEDAPAPEPGREGAGRARRFRSAAVLGLLLGLLALARAEGLLTAACFIAAILLGQKGRGPRIPSMRARIGTAAIVVAALGVTLAPWMIRNQRNLSAFNQRFEKELAEALPTVVPISIYGPLNLALANHAGAEGGFSRSLLPVRGAGRGLDLLDREHLELLLHGDRVAAAFILDRPMDWSRLVLRKWELYFGALRLGFTQWNAPGGFTGLRRPVDVFVPDSVAGAVVTVPLLLLGLALQIRRGGHARRWAGLVAALTLLSLATTTFFFGYARLGLLLMPLWLSAIASALIAILGRLPRLFTPARRARITTAVAATVIVLVLGVDIAGAFSGRHIEATGEARVGERFIEPDRPVRLRVPR